MNKQMLISLYVLVGVVLCIIGCIYFVTPANHLPHFFPGFTTSLTKKHYTHAVASFLLGIGSFIFAWFQSGKKSSK